MLVIPQQGPSKTFRNELICHVYLPSELPANLAKVGMVPASWRGVGVKIDMLETFSV